MTAEQFIEAVEQKGLLSDKLIQGMRKKLASSASTVPAKSLAKFLVAKKHLSPHMAAVLLNESVDVTVDDEDDPGDGFVMDELAEAARDEPKKSDSVNVSLAPIQDVEHLSAAKSSTDVDPDLMEDPVHAEIALRAGRDPLKSSSGILGGTRAKRGRTRHGEDSGRNLETGDRKEKKGRKKKKVKRKNEWDSPLLLFGGGGLILLVLCGVAVVYLLNRETGDEQLQLARNALDQGSYSQAISNYERFLERFPGHPERSAARVQLAMARLRRATEGGRNYKSALEVAQTEIEAIEDEEKFADAHAELAALLPQIALGLAAKAEETSNTASAEADEWVALATTALELCNNTKYIPRSLRDDAELLEARQSLARVELQQQSFHDLRAALASMDEAIQSGNTRQAYDVHRQLVKSHPQLANDEELLAQLVKTSQAEKAEITFVREERAADRGEPDSPVVASLALAHPRGGRASTAQGVVFVRVDGALYGLDLSSGRLLWRRFVGFDSDATPVRVDDGVLVVDTATQALSLLDSGSGEVRWRQPFDEEFHTPLVVGGRAYLASQSGRLYVLDVASGELAGHVRFAQPLPAPPAVDRRGEHLYLVGEHSSLYTISLRDLSCEDVFFLGHAPGSVQTSPVLVLNKLALFENDGVETCQFRLLQLSEAALPAKVVAEQRLSGLVLTPPLVDGRRLTVGSDRGQIDVYEIGPVDNLSSLTKLATRGSSGGRPLVRHAALSKGHVWVGDQQLTKYAVLATGNRLPVRDVERNYEGATFVHPLQVFDNTLIHVRRPGDRVGVAVAAMETESGRALWETDIAVPLAGTPIADPARQALVAATANGYAFLFDRNSIRRRIQDEPLPAGGESADPPELTSAVELGEGRAVFAAVQRAERVLLFDGANRDRPLTWMALPGQLAAPPAHFREGAVLPLELGQIFYVDPQSGEQLAAPFQPRLQPRTIVPWLPIGTQDDPSQPFVVSDGRDRVYLVGLSQDPRPHLTALAETNLEGFPLETGFAIVANTAYAGTEDGKLAAFELPSLKLGTNVELSGRVIAGPYRTGDRLLVVCDDDQIHCVADGKLVWSVPLAHGDLAGVPLALDDGILLAYRRGIAQKISPTTGEEISAIDAGQPLSAGPTQFQNRPVLVTHDGTLLVVDRL